MSTFREVFAEIYRDSATEGVPATGDHEPDKAAIRAIGPLLDTALAALAATKVDVSKASRALLEADLAWPANSIGLVTADPVPANNDLYVKSGASGAGAWTLTSSLSIAIASRAQPYVDAAATSAASAAASAANSASSIALDYGIVLDPRGAAVWDLRFWKTALFQDAAATVPVTASGQRVGCVRNRLGDTSWDLIQSTDAKRPTFMLDGEIPRIDCAAGEGLASRSNKALSLPCYLLTAARLSSTHVNAVFGFINNTGDKLTIAANSLARAWLNIASPTLGRALAAPTSPNYTIPLETVAVIDSLAVAGSADLMVNGGVQDAVGSPKATTWTAADSLADLSFGVNIASQALGAGVPDAAKATTWFGGLVSFSPPTDRSGLVASFRARMTPEIRAADRVIVIDGDSTGDDISSADNQITEEVFFRWARDELPAVYPNATIYYRNWARVGDLYTGWRKLATGAGTERVFISNASVSGSQPSYHMAERFERAIAVHPHIDEVIWNHGHNMPVSLPDPNGYQRFGEWADAMDQMRRAYPTAAHLAIRTHPNGLIGNETILPVVTALDLLLSLYNDVAVADIYTHFDSAGRPADWYLSDKVHPSVPDGVTQQLSVFAPAYAAWARPTLIAPPLMGRGANGLANGRFDDFSGAVPDGWTKSGPGTCDRSVKQVDTEVGDNYSVRLAQTTGSTYLEQVVNAVPYRGQTVIFGVRQFISPGAPSISAGRLQAFSDGTGAVSSSSWVYDTSGKPTGGWRWVYHVLPVPADATQITLRAYAAASGEAEVFYGRATMVAGLQPKDER